MDTMVAINLSKNLALFWPQVCDSASVVSLTIFGATQEPKIRENAIKALVAAILVMRSFALE